MQLLCTLWVIFTGALLWTVFCLKGILTLSLLIKLHPPVTWWIRCTYLEQEGLQPAKLSSTLSTLSSPLPPHPEEGTLPGQSHQATPSADFPLTTHPQGSAQLRGWWELVRLLLPGFPVALSAGRLQESGASSCLLHGQHGAASPKGHGGIHRPMRLSIQGGERGIVRE